MSDSSRRPRTEYQAPLPHARAWSVSETRPPLPDDPDLFHGGTPHLRVLCPERGCWDVVLQQPRLLIGRSPDCDLQLPYAAVSRQHAILYREQGSWILRECGSSYGSLLNGAAFSPGRDHVLKHGDTLQIARVLVQFRRDDRRVRADGGGMQFSSLPSSMQVRLRQVYVDGGLIFDPGDTLPVGSAGGLRLPVDPTIEFLGEVVEIEMQYPGNRQLRVLGEILMRHPGSTYQVLCLKLHRMDTDTIDDIIRPARRDPWITVLSFG